MYKLTFCTGATCTRNLYKLQLAQSPYFSVKQLNLMDLCFKIHKINIFDINEWQIHCNAVFPLEPTGR